MSFWCSMPLLAQLMSCGAQAPLAVGYVEGEYVSLAPLEVAQVETVLARRGDMVKQGAPLVRMEAGDAKIAVAQAEAAVAVAQAQLADLQVGRRPDEIKALDAALTSAQAQTALSQKTFERTQDLLRRGAATQSQLDQARTQLDVDKAMSGQAEANLAVAHLPARAEAIRAAESSVKQAEQALAQAEWRLSRRTLTAPASGRIDDVLRDPGDVAGPQAPVLSLLPQGAVKLRVYVPEPALSSITVGAKLTVRCDGCGDGLTATVSYVSPDPEFTPPVIYSLENRQKLVYLVEARPDNAPALQPGQIVDVDLAR